ncbi:copper amine oxidase N-terminal domain-containing protein [Paenibacillus sp. LjRoot153]|uniref:stalk domain-containing protein n=1 Tax=Paenibacillus sp. LjRoot153 TaxID=3342270 RepID=UPI003ECCDFD5
MKKKLLIALGLTGVIAASIAVGAYAATDIKLFINGKIINTDLQIVDGSSYVPLRVVSESLGANVKWDGDKREIIITGQTSQVGQTVYENTQYGFRFTLPDSWKGYTIVTDKWEGLSAGDAQGDNVSGAKLSIRHPEWTAVKPRQDIPILVFAVDQWNELQQDKFHIGAAPIGPSELTRNDKYVFALPARYNFAYPDGYQEVEDILKSNPIQPMK